MGAAAVNQGRGSVFLIWEKSCQAPCRGGLGRVAVIPQEVVPFVGERLMGGAIRGDHACGQSCSSGARGESCSCNGAVVGETSLYPGAPEPALSEAEGFAPVPCMIYKARKIPTLCFLDFAQKRVFFEGFSAPEYVQ
jgi:hypothetical protein